MEDKLKIINSFGLQVEEVEPTVYKVINTDLDVNINKLQWALGNCILFKSSNIRREKTLEGYNTIIAHVYYILLDYENDELYHKYIRLISNTMDNVGVISHKRNDDTLESIDTIYSRDEMKREGYL